LRRRPFVTTFPGMRSFSAALGILALVLLTGAAAQPMLPGGSIFNPPLPAPPPPPLIEPPVIPQMDAPPAAPRLQPSSRGSFSRRIRRCLDEAAALGLDPSERAAYSRACAN